MPGIFLPRRNLLQGEITLKYSILLWPHANARYQTESVHLAEGELSMLLEKVCPEASPCITVKPEMNILEFETACPLSAEALSALRSHSLMYVLFETQGELMRPIAGRAETYLEGDLPGILKYKGKTNEIFTSMLINAALYSSAFWKDAGKRLKFIDPMCSRGTSLFLAVNRGWDADGGDISAVDLRELDQFFKRYLEYHRIKHTIARKSYTLKNSKPAPAVEFGFAADNAAYRAGDVHMLRSVECDCGRINSVFGKNRYHIMACDLPYGVQHSAGSERFDQLLARVLPVWRDVLLPGGAIALSYNTNTLKTETLRRLMAESGFDVMTGGVYDGFSHWVEQAVTRDIAVGVRPPKK
jgi:hypothetical protein